MAASEQEIKEAIRESLARGEPKPWLWDEHGDEIIGKAVRKERRNTQHGEADFLILEVDNEERSVLVGNLVLIKKLASSHLKPGEWVGIRRLGEREPVTVGGRKYIDFAVRVYGRQDRALEWGDTKALPETVDGEMVGPDLGTFEEEADTW